MAARAAAFALQQGARPSSTEEPPNGPSDGGAGLRAHLLSEYKKGALSAKAVCTIAWHATSAGAANVSDLAYDPASPGQHQAEHLRAAIGARAASTFYMGSVPMWDHVAEQRIYIDFPINAPHEQFASAYEASPKDFRVGDMADRSVLPALYGQHMVVQAQGDLACPIGYFSDAVPHTKKDSFYAFYWSNLLTGTRYLICALRKSDLCKCGCRGLCTFGAVLRMIVWSFTALASGKYPACRHDGCPF